MEAIADQPGAPERTNPFPGLRPFEPDEDHLFFGRERETDELLRRLRTHRFVSVLGTSGSGKSSLVRSGLIPSLHSGFMVTAGSAWRVAILRPGDNPIGNLADALNAPDVLGGDPDIGETQRMLLETSLRRSDLGLADCVRHARLSAHENVVIVIDQFEELFRFRERREAHGARDEAVAFAKLLLGAANQDEVPVYVVLTMRSDFIGDCMEYPGLPEAINRGQYLIPRMTRDELRAAITGPVAVGGGTIAPRLVSRLLNEVGDDPDQLPVLQHAMMRSWDHWLDVRADDEPLDLQHYDAIGTMADALSQHAEEAYAELPSARAREITERLFKALTDTRLDDRGVRRPTAVDEVAAITAAAGTEVIEVVNVFRKPGRSFLMPPTGVELGAESILDLSHESLMRNWTRLVGWVDEETVSGKAYRRLCRSARRHANHEGALWSDPELAIGLKWREENKPNEAWASRYDPSFADAMRFLDESRTAEQARIEAKANERRAKLRRARILSAVLGSAALITLVFGVFAVRAQRAAEAAEEQAVAVSDFLVSLFEVVDPKEARGDSITAREIIDEGARKVETELADQPRIQARLMGTIGEVYMSLGLYDPAQELLDRAYETSLSELGETDPGTLANAHRLGEIRFRRGLRAEAVELFEQTLEARRRELGADHPDTLDTMSELAAAYLGQSRYSLAEETARAALDAQRRVLGDDHEKTLETMRTLADAHRQFARFEDAETLFLEALDAQRATLGDNHPDTIATVASLGGLYSELARYDEAEELLEANLRSQSEVFGDEHPRTLSALSQLAGLDEDRGNWPRAEQRWRQVIDGRSRVLGPEHPSTLDAQRWLAWLLGVSQSRYDEAEALAKHVFETGQRVLGEEEPQVRQWGNTLAAIYSSRGRNAEAEPIYKANVEIFRRLYGENSSDVFAARNNLAIVYAAWGQPARYESMMKEIFEDSRELRGPDHPSTLLSSGNYGRALLGQQRYDEAEAQIKETLERAERVLGPDNPSTLGTRVQLVFTYYFQNRYEEAEALALDALERTRRVFGDEHPQTLGIMTGFGDFYTQLGRLDEAEAFLTNVLETRRRVQGDEHVSTLGAFGALAGHYQNRNMTERALELRRERNEIRRRIATREDATASDKLVYARTLIFAQTELQDFDAGLRFALASNEMTDFAFRDSLTVLADAYFRAGRTDKAIEYQTKALAMVEETDVNNRNSLQTRLTEYQAAAGDVTAKRRGEVARIARLKEAAERAESSPRAKNSYARRLLMADPPDLRDPAAAVAVAEAMSDQTGHGEAFVHGTLALAYHLAGRREDAVETQRKGLALMAEEDRDNRSREESVLLIYEGNGRKDPNLLGRVSGRRTGKADLQPFEVEFRRFGNVLSGTQIKAGAGAPAGTERFRFDLGSGELEIQEGDSGWTNTRWEAGDWIITTEGDLIVWNPKNWRPVRFP